MLRALALLAVVVAACWPTWGIPDLDGTEGRRVQIALEMLRAGDWLVPTLGGEPTWAKPPLHYWLLCLCIEAVGDSVWSVRLPSVLAAWLSAAFAHELLRPRFGALAAWFGALGVACSPVVAFKWPTAEIDPVFASLVASSLWALACGFAEARTRLVVLSGLLGGLALLQKGPPYFLFAAGVYVVWWRHARLRGLLWHFAPMLVVALLYFAPLWLLRVDPGAMLAVANDESVGRLAFYGWRQVADTPDFWARAVGLALPFALWARMPRPRLGDGRDAARDAIVRACGLAAVLAVAALTFFPGRPTRYLLPNVPLLAFALAPAMAAYAGSGAPLAAGMRRALLALAAAGVVVAVAAPFVAKAGPLAPVCGLGIAAGAALATTRLRVVLFVALLPLLASWTIGIDRANAWPQGPRARAAAAATLRAELDRLGVDRAELSTSGHFDSPLLLAAGLLPPGDEGGRKPWRTRWVLCEAKPTAPVQRDDYVERWRLGLLGKAFVLCERAGDGR
jgi:4-amino-4-deoxy-L-arabinose transferase-like glycosyltransferase